MGNWIIRNKFTILFAILGIVAGYYLNVLANRASEKKIIDALTAEIESLKQKQSTSRLTADEQNKLLSLQAQLNLLKSRQ